MKIGERIRKRRKELGISLRELGESTKLSVGFLSQIENDQGSPSLASLLAIATELKVPIFYFLNSQESNPVVRADKRRQLQFSNSHLGIDLLTPHFNWQLLPILVRLEPRAIHQALPLIKPTEQWLYVLQGCLEIKIGSEAYSLEVGDSIHYNGEMLFEVASVSDEELLFICCITPPAL